MTNVSKDLRETIDDKQYDITMETTVSMDLKRLIDDEQYDVTMDLKYAVEFAHLINSGELETQQKENDQNQNPTEDDFRGT